MSKQWTRDNDALVDVFAIAGDRELTLETAQMWTDQQCREAEEWAWALHFRASDNPHVKVPSMPAHVQALPSVLAPHRPLTDHDRALTGAKLTAPAGTDC